MSVIILVGGLPGSGKSSLAEIIYQGLGHEYPDPMAVSADDFFYVKDAEAHCSYQVLNDPTLLRGTDLYRYRVGRSLHVPGSTYPDPHFAYRWERPLQPHAHVWCIEQVRNELARSDRAAVVVHNTFTQRWEMEPYLKLAKDFKARIDVTRLYDGGCSDEVLAHRNSHGVPIEVIRLFRGNWETDWRNADPTPPWERPEATPPQANPDPFELPDEFA